MFHQLYSVIKNLNNDVEKVLPQIQLVNAKVVNAKYKRHNLQHFLFVSEVVLAYFFPEFYFKFYGVYTNIPSRYCFFGMLVFVVGC